jgi:hypothetical protein
MIRGIRALTVAVAVTVASAAIGVGTASAATPSLQPAATERAWQQLVQRPRTFALTAGATDCRPLRAVFYVPTDWLRLATKLAAAAAPCVEYYISIPPLAADKTAFRYDQPWRIRALGPNFHVLAEISTNGWGNWVDANGGSWYAAGQEARRRMAASGFDVASGDGWIVNELSSAVVRGIGNARANMRDLVRGLHDGDGGPAVKGGVFVYGVSQATASLSTWKAYLQDWYRDTPFWNDMAANVADWSQELYGDVRTYAVGGSSLVDRRDALDGYLQHELTLAGAGPGEVGAARAFLQSAYSPLANAGWQYDTGFGWTAVPYDQMQDYVSAQTYALRSFAARTGEAVDHFGFAWSPRSPEGMSASDYSAQTGAIADRLAAAIRDSAQGGADPGIGACSPAGANVWCSTVLAGAAFNDAWKTFTGWSPDVIVLAGTTTATAGQAVPLTAQLQVAGLAWPEPSAVTVTLSSDSARGEFAPGPNGPWTRTLDVVVPAGFTDASFYYRDTGAGSATVTAGAATRVGATMSVRVNAGAPASLAVSPANATVAAGGSQQFSASGADAFGNPVSPPVTWSVGAGTPGTISPSGLFTAGSTTGSGTVVASADGVSASTTLNVTVAPAALRTQTISFGPPSGRTFGDADFTVAATASSGLPVTFAAGGSCTISGTTVHLTGAGSCTVTAAQPGNATFAAAPSVSQTFTIAKAGQTISFAAPPSKTAGDLDFVVVATASSGLSVALASSGDCTVSGARVHLVRAGSCTLTAMQPGDANYKPAPSVARTFAIARATQLKPPVRCSVPKLVGKRLTTAKRLLKQRHCATGTTKYVYSKKAKKGIVVAQGVRPGRVVAAGTKIKLTVGRGAKR